MSKWISSAEKWDEIGDYLNKYEFHEKTLSICPAPRSSWYFLIVLYGKKKPDPEEKIAVYKCPSYYDDNNLLQDCECGEC